MVDYYYPNRTMCEVLQEMRECYKTRNFAYLPGLIEEVQSMGNRMEAAIGDMKDIEGIHERLQRQKKESKELSKTLDTLSAQVTMLEKERDRLSDEVGSLRLRKG